MSGQLQRTKTIRCRFQLAYDGFTLAVDEHIPAGYNGFIRAFRLWKKYVITLCGQTGAGGDCAVETGG